MPAGIRVILSQWNMFLCVALFPSFLSLTSSTFIFPISDLVKDYGKGCKSGIEITRYHSRWLWSLSFAGLEAFFAANPSCSRELTGISLLDVSFLSMDNINYFCWTYKPLCPQFGGFCNDWTFFLLWSAFLGKKTLGFCVCGIQYISLQVNLHQ